MAALKRRDFRTPSKFPVPIIVACDSPKWPAWEHLGAWRRAVPEELIHSYVMAIARDVRVFMTGKHSDSDEEAEPKPADVDEHTLLK